MADYVVTSNFTDGELLNERDRLKVLLAQLRQYMREHEKYQVNKEKSPRWKGMKDFEREIETSLTDISIELARRKIPV